MTTNPGENEILIPRVTTLYYLKCQVKKIRRHAKKQE